MRQFWKEESGAVSIVESAFIFPIVFFVIVFLMMGSLFLYDQVAIISTAQQISKEDHDRDAPLLFLSTFYYTIDDESTTWPQQVSIHAYGEGDFSSFFRLLGIDSLFRVDETVVAGRYGRSEFIQYVDIVNEMFGGD